MLTLSPGTPIYLFTQPADMRKSFDGLSGLVDQAFDQMNEGLFVFHNKRRDRLKVLYFDHDGLALWYKRLEQGTFVFPVAREGQAQLTVSPADLRLILDGVDLKSVKKLKRYKPVVDDRSKPRTT